MLYFANRASKMLFASFRKHKDKVLCYFKKRTKARENIVIVLEAYLKFCILIDFADSSLEKNFFFIYL